MKYRDFSEAHRAARKAHEVFTGDDNWPGFSVHDRCYALPEGADDDSYGGPVVAVVRAHDQHNKRIRIQVVRVVWRDGPDLDMKWSELDHAQLHALAEITYAVRRWVNGFVDDLPPSTSRHWTPEEP